MSLRVWIRPVLTSSNRDLQGAATAQPDPGFWVRANELSARLRELRSSPPVGSSTPGVTLMTGRSTSFTLHDTATYKSNATALDLSRFRTVLGVDEVGC